MLQKFKKIKDKTYFYRVLGTETGREPNTIQNHWFKQMFCAVPKPHLKRTELVIDTFIDYEKEREEAIEKLKLKYFGK